MGGSQATCRDGAGRLPVDGVLVVDKPEGPTSHDVVATARRALGVRRVGHTGTLDPMATGVLALVVGRATRLAQFLSGHDKEYLARIRLGVATDTWDRTGTVVSQVEAGTLLPRVEAVTEALRSHLGEQAQLPPAFSAKRVDGVRSYALARRGQTAEMAAAIVSLHSATIEAFEPPLVDVRLTCSAGFYVRALADSLGRRLGCGACLDRLRRTASGAFTLDGAVTLGDVVTSPSLAFERLLPLEQALPDVPTVTLTADGTRRALHGNDVGRGDWSDVRLKPDATYGRKPDALHDRKPDATYGRKPDALHDRKPEATCDRKPDALHDQKPDALHDRKPDATCDRKPDALHDRKPDATCDDATWNQALAGFDSGSTAYVQLLSPDGRLVAIARPVGASVLHPAVVLG